MYIRIPLCLAAAFLVIDSSVASSEPTTQYYVKAQPSAKPDSSDAAPGAAGGGGCDGFNVLLRQNWTDIDLLSCPQSVEKASGAQASYSGDNIKNNYNLTLQGTGAVVYSISSGPYSFSFGGYDTANEVANSAKSQASTNAKTNAAGGFAQFGVISSSYGPYLANYFRVRGAEVEDDIKHTSSSMVTAEWLPVYDDQWLHISAPFVLIPNVVIVRFDPELLAQYNELSATKKVLDFNQRTDAFRVGPQLTLRIYPAWTSLHGYVTYHWGYETYSGRSLELWSSNVTYNLDKAGHLGLTGTYQRGHVEETGTYSSTYKVGLSGKL